MRIKSVLLFISMHLLNVSTFAQSETFYSKDGYSVDVEIADIDPDNGRNTSIYFGLFGPEGINVAGFSYYKPGSWYLNALAGPSGAFVDGNIFLKSKLNQVTYKQSVHMKNDGYTITRYVAKIPGIKRNSFGLHLGSGYVNYALSAAETIDTKSAINVIGGITFLSAKHTHWKISDQYREAQGTAIGRFNMDVVYYYNFKEKVDEKFNIVDNYNSSSVGLRLYFDGKTTVWSRQGRMSIHYMLGLGINTNMDTPFFLFGGFGLGYSFN